MVCLGRLELRCVLFVYGILVHLAWTDANPLLNHRSRWSMAFVGYPLTAIWIAVAGGLFVTLFTLPLVQPRRGSARPSGTGVILSAAGRGVAATVFALETFWVAVSVVVALRHSAFHAPLALHFALTFIEIQTYGAVVVMDSLPFAVCYGALAGLFLRRLARSTPS